MKTLAHIIRLSVVISVYAWLLVRLFTDPVHAASDTYLDPEIVECIEKVAPQYSISVELIEALVEAESSGNPYAVSISGKHYGLCQISYGHKDIMDTLDIDRAEMLYDPMMNLHASCMYLSELREQHGDIFEALCHFEGRSSPIHNSYVRKIVERSYELEDIHGLHD